MLELKNIDAFYGKKQVLFDINLKFNNNERILIIGPNGAGKSTLFKIIGGLLYPKKGKIFFKNNDITNFTPEKRINLGIGYLLQSNNIFVKLTVKENLELAKFNYKKIDFEKIFYFFPFLKEKLNKIAGLLSGGERQALAISMILMKSPDLLILDEPTSGLSPKAVKKMFEYIKILQEYFKTSTLCMVEHNLKYALEWATRLVIVNQGKVLEKDEIPQNYLKNPQKLEEIFFREN